MKFPQVCMFWEILMLQSVWGANRPRWGGSLQFGGKLMYTTKDGQKHGGWGKDRLNSRPYTSQVQINVFSDSNNLKMKWWNVILQQRSQHSFLTTQILLVRGDRASYIGLEFFWDKRQDWRIWWHSTLVSKFQLLVALRKKVDFIKSSTSWKWRQSFGDSSFLSLTLDLKVLYGDFKPFGLLSPKFGICVCCSFHQSTVLWNIPFRYLLL